MPDDDDTIRLTRMRPPDRAATASPQPASAPPRRSRRPLLAAAGILAVAVVAGVGAAFLHAGALAPLRPPPPAMAPTPVMAPAPGQPSPGQPTPEFAFRDATEAQINANTATSLTFYRFLPNPRILVLDFPDLHAQAMMLNRVAALVEKAGQPRDRVLDDTQLATAIAAGGDTPDTYYYGHDYSAAALSRFFALAARDHVPLTPQEAMLRRLLDQVGYLQPNANGAVISIPHAGLDPAIDMQGRATILHHELSHGEYFTNPAYADYAREFFRAGMTTEQRTDFIRFLGSEAYDTAEPDLMVNETQAYLMHTPDARFFRAAAVNLSDAALDQLRTGFLLGMPRGWLRDCTSVPPAR